MTIRVAAIDIGSNTFKLTIADLSPDGSIAQRHSEAGVVRLGEGMTETGEISRDRLDLAVETLRALVERANADGVDRTIAVATEAVRIARNRSHFVEAIRERTGLAIDVIDSRREAELTATGVLAQIETSGRMLIIDIGGGSTELISVDTGLVTGLTSVPLGSGNLTDQYVTADPPTAGELATIHAVITDATRDFLHEVGPIDRLVLVGGVGEFALVVAEERSPFNPGGLKRAMMRSQTIPAAQLARLIAAPVARARVVPAGFTIAQGIAEQCTPGSIEVVANGLRYGLLLEAAKQN